MYYVKIIGDLGQGVEAFFARVSWRPGGDNDMHSFLLEEPLGLHGKPVPDCIREWYEQNLMRVKHLVRATLAAQQSMDAYRHKCLGVTAHGLTASVEGEFVDSIPTRMIIAEMQAAALSAQN